MYEDITILERFFEKVDKEGPISPHVTTRCWTWSGGGGPDGYGRLSFRGRTEGAHRVAWQLSYGPIPQSNDSYGTMFVCHHCDNPSCVRPSHLFLGDQYDNMIDMLSKGRSGGLAQFGETNPNSKLTWDDVDEIRRLRKDKRYTYREISEMFPVSYTAIKKIICGDRWPESQRKQKGPGATDK